MSTEPDRKLKFLIAHNGYLGQFEYFAAWLRGQGHEVLVMHRDKLIRNSPFQSVKFNDLDIGDRTGVTFSREAENAIITAGGAAATALKLRDVDKYSPDVMLAHCGWGTGLLLKGIWPKAIYIAYHEWFYRLDADRERPADSSSVMTGANMMQFVHNLGRNYPIISEFIVSDANWSPNEFQRSQFPASLQKKIDIMHDGVDIDFFKPDPKVRLKIGETDLSDAKNIVTYVSRGFEPLRKYPDFMRAVKLVQNRLPDTDFLIVGDNRVAYGNKLSEGTSWLHNMLDELDLDLSKIHFTGFLDKQNYLKALQASSAHIYMTEPFVLSWSFFEALSSGCALVSTDNLPIIDFLTHERTGYLAKTGDVEDLAANIERAITDKALTRKIRRAARQYICDNFSLDTQSKKRMDAIYQLLQRDKLDRDVDSASLERP